MKNELFKTPSAIDVEVSVLGGMLMDAGWMLTALEMLSEESFYKSEHQYIFSAIQSINNKGGHVDILTTSQELFKQKTITKAGGPGYVSSLTNTVGYLGKSIENYCLILREKEMARKQIDFGRLVIQKAEMSTDVFELNEFMADRIHNIMNLGELKKEVNTEELAIKLSKKIEKAGQMGGITGIKTGIKSQDRLFRGFQKTDFIVLAARPGMGKTALALCEFIYMTVVEQKPCIFFSLEMSAEQLYQRLVSIWSNIPGDKMNSGNFDENDWAVYHSRVSNLITDKMIIVDDVYDITGIRARVKKERMKREIGSVYVDYIQLVEAKAQSREQEIAKISRQLKLLAKEIKCPVIGLAQLNRKVDERSDKRPKLADLRESGAIEQDADVVTFLYRPQYYGEGKPGLAYRIVAKHRNGALKDIEMQYIHELTKFKDVDENPF